MATIAADRKGNFSCVEFKDGLAYKRLYLNGDGICEHVLRAATVFSREIPEIIRAKLIVTDNVACFEMEQGQHTLREFVQSQTYRMFNSWERLNFAYNVLKDLSLQLCNLHHYSIVHNDLHDGNVIQMMDGSWKIIDFGWCSEDREEMEIVPCPWQVSVENVHSSGYCVTGTEIDTWSLTFLFSYCIYGTHVLWVSKNQSVDQDDIKYNYNCYLSDLQQFCDVCPHDIAKFLIFDPEQRRLNASANAMYKMACSYFTQGKNFKKRLKLCNIIDLMPNVKKTTMPKCIGTTTVTTFESSLKICTTY